MDQPVLAPASVVDDPAELPAEAPAAGAAETHADAPAPEHGDVDSSVYAETHAPLRADSLPSPGAPAQAPHVRTDARAHKKPISALWPGNPHPRGANFDGEG